MKVRTQLQSAKSLFRDAHINEVDAELLLAHLLGITRMDLHNSVKVEQRLSEVESVTDIFDEFAHSCQRRLQGEPVQYITGVAHFHNLTLSVGPGVLIPRPETEAIVESILTHLKSVTTPTSVIDLGAGSGALAIAIATQAPITRVVAVENDEAALAYLKKNIEACDVQISVVAESVETALQGVKADIVVANPPYIKEGAILPIDVMKYEPHFALFGGSTGMEIPTMFIKAAARLLKTDGLLLIEHGEDQPELIATALSSNFVNIINHRDHNDRPRWTSAARR